MKAMSYIFIVLLAFVIACSPTPPASKQTNLPTVPTVDVSHLDAELARLISVRQEAVRSNPLSGEDWGKLGQVLHAGEFLDQAQYCYLRANQLEPTSGRWLYLASVLQLQNEPDLALQNLSRAVELTPSTNDAPRLQLARALAERGRAAEAVPHLQHLLELHPAHPMASLELARINIVSNNLDSVEQLLRPCLTNGFTARAAHLLLSQVKQRAGDTKAAFVLSRRAESIPDRFDWPDVFLREVQSLKIDQQAILERVHTWMMQGRLQEAENTLNQVLARAPDDPETLLLHGRLRFQQRRCGEAEQIFLRYLTIRTNSLQGFVQLGLSQFCEGRWTDAASAFRRALELKPDFAQAHYNLGLALSRANDSKAAIESFRSALRCQPGDANAHAALAEEFLRLKQIPEARREAEEALKLDPKQPKAVRVRDALNTGHQKTNNDGSSLF